MSVDTFFEIFPICRITDVICKYFGDADYHERLDI